MAKSDGRALAAWRKVRAEWQRATVISGPQKSSAASPAPDDK